MLITARVDYAVRAMVVLAGHPPGVPMKADAIAESQGVSGAFLDQILAQLRRAGLVASQRGADGGFRLSRPAETITPADVIRAVDGPLADLHGAAPEDAHAPEAAAAVRDLWVATRAALRMVLETVTIADLAAGALPGPVQDLISDPAAWSRR